MNLKLLMLVALGLACVHFATAEENLENLLQEMDGDDDDGEDELNTLEDEGDDDDDELMSLLSKLDDDTPSDDLDKRRTPALPRPRPRRCSLRNSFRCRWRCCRTRNFWDRIRCFRSLRCPLPCWRCPRPPLKR